MAATSCLPGPAIPVEYPCTMENLPAKPRRGRPKGSKNRKTLLKEQIRQEIREKAGDLVLDSAEKVVQKVIAQALDGCRVSQKIIMDRFMPARKAVEGDNDGPSRPTVHITVAGTPGPDAPGVIIEGTTTEED